jgi:hypothetical protein
MSTSSSDSPGFSRTRRALLGLGGVGLATGVAGYLGWQRSDDKAFQGAAREDSKTTPDSPTPISEDQAASAGTQETPVASAKFRPHLKTNFTISSEGAGNACKLVQISAEKHQKTPGATWATFCLIFEAPAGFLAEGGICQVSHPQLEAMELFLSPVGNPKEKTFLQAAFAQRI